ncbi:MAG TPA: hypothetical protein DEA59_04880 [Microbacterium sp.]|nr:hypothetical protein [Microbacterium sp.]HBR88588.1 hypothetical protein [Microbacterium sp.]|tara:strand:- start:163 stop:501 length:339 start_codon:yes stop_codon:yes gene_type:complete
MRPESAAFLWDVRDAADRIGSFIDGLTIETYVSDDLRRSAVERQLEIIGEALNNLRRVDAETAALIPDVHRIIGLRNVLAHGYAVVDDEVVWAAAFRRVPELRALVDGLLAE